ncbi:MAG: hypothetical protein CBARDCOR_4541 [uncultured Caballeronia sp.]|nr:MAG: hypothetical protein CBARDCOR_4541 [uncultured Caballeronia sp.]
MDHIISAYALGVVIGAPLITIFFAKIPRRAMLIGLMLMVCVRQSAQRARAELPAAADHTLYFRRACRMARISVWPR